MRNCGLVVNCLVLGRRSSGGLKKQRGCFLFGIIKILAFRNEKIWLKTKVRIILKFLLYIQTHIIKQGLGNLRDIQA